MDNIKNLKLYKGCLIIVDMVNGFIREGVLHDDNISKIIPRQIELIKEAKANNKLIVFIKDTHNENSVEFIRFGSTKHCIKNTFEQELVDELKVFESDKDTISIEKNSTSFMEAPMFRELIEKQSDLVEFDIVGCCTDICVFNGTMGLANYLDEHDREHIIRVHRDAIATFNEIERRKYVEASELLLEQQGVKILTK